MNSKPVAPKSSWLANRFQRFAHPYGWTVTWEMLHPAGWRTEGHGDTDRGVLGDMGHPPHDRGGREANLGAGKTRADAFGSQAPSTRGNKSTFLKVFLLLTPSGGDCCGCSHPHVRCLVGPVSLSPARPVVRGMGHPQMPARRLGTKLPLRVIIQMRNLHSWKKPKTSSTLFTGGEHHEGLGPRQGPLVAAPCRAARTPTDERGKKEHGKPSPHPGEQAQRPCAMGKSNRAGLLFYFFASWFLLTTPTSGSEVSWQRRGLAGPLSLRSR